MPIKLAAQLCVFTPQQFSIVRCYVRIHVGRMRIRHVHEWMTVLRETEELGLRAWLKMVRGLASGWVGKREWRRRARTCVRCPLYDRELRRCHGPFVGGRRTGCGCYLPWMLRVRRLYPLGCWGRQFVGGNFGWE